MKLRPHARPAGGGSRVEELERGAPQPGLDQAQPRDVDRQPDAQRGARGDPPQPDLDGRGDREDRAGDDPATAGSCSWRESATNDGTSEEKSPSIVNAQTIVAAAIANSPRAPWGMARPRGPERGAACASPSPRS